MGGAWASGSGRSLDPSAVCLTSSLPALPALYLLPQKVLFLFPSYTILPLRPPVPVPTSSVLSQLDCSQRQLPCVPAPVSQEPSPHRDAGVYAKGAGVGSGADLALGRDFPATLWPPSEKEASPRGRLGQDGSDLPRPYHHPLGVSLNIGTLFWASTESSVAPRLKNKN